MYWALLTSLSACCTASLKIFKGGKKGLGGAKLAFATPQIRLWLDCIWTVIPRQSRFLYTNTTTTRRLMVALCAILMVRRDTTISKPEPIMLLILPFIFSRISHIFHPLLPILSPIIL